MIYVVQYTGADVGGDNAVILDRFLSVVRGNVDSRSTRHDFIAHSDSPAFLEGVRALRGEIQNAAATPDGKFDYRIPFELFDEDKSGSIILAEFEKKIRSMDIGTFMTEQVLIT